MDLEGDDSRGGVAEVVLDRVGHGIGSRFLACLITHHIAGDEDKSLEGSLVPAQIGFQADCGSIGVGHMVHDPDRDQASLPDLGADVVRLGGGGSPIQGRWLQGNGPLCVTGRVGDGVGDVDRVGGDLTRCQIDPLMIDDSGLDARRRIG